MPPIYTRGGDAGDTSLADGTRIAKSSARVEAYGTVDEANAHVGRARGMLPLVEEAAELEWALDFLQQRLYNCASSLATPVDHADEHTPHLTDDDVILLERAIDTFFSQAGEVDHFVIPAGTDLACQLHVARTVVRRAERRVVALSELETVEEFVLRFLNRSSDVLFAAAHYANVVLGPGEEDWDPNASAPEL